MPSRRISAPDALAPIQEISVQPYSSYNSDNVNMLTRIVSGDRNRDFIVNGLDVFGYNRVNNEILSGELIAGGSFSTQQLFTANWRSNNISWDSVTQKVVATIPYPFKTAVATMTSYLVLPVSDVGYSFKISFTTENIPRRLSVSLGSETYSYEYLDEGEHLLYLRLNNENRAPLKLSFSIELDQRDNYSNTSCYLDNISLVKVINEGTNIEPLARRFNFDNDALLNHNNIPEYFIHPHNKCFVSRGVAIKDEVMLNLLGIQSEDPVSVLEYGDVNSWIHADPYTSQDFNGNTLLRRIHVPTGQTEYHRGVFDSDGRSRALLYDDGESPDYIRKVCGDINKIKVIDGEEVSAKVRWAYVCVYYSYFKNPEPNKAYIGLVREETLRDPKYGEDYLPLAKLRFVDSITADAIIYYPDRIDWGYIDATRITYDHLNQLKHWTNKPLNVSLALDLLASRIYNFKGMLYFQTHQNFLNWIGAKTETDGKYLLSDGGSGIIGTGHGPIDYLQNINGADTENSYDLCAYILETNSFWRSQILSNGNEPVKLNYNLRILWTEIQQKRFELNWSTLNNGNWPNEIPSSWSYWNGSEWDDSPSQLLSWNDAKSKWPSEYYAEKPTGSGGYTKINPFNPEGMGMVPGPDASLDDVKQNRFLRSDGTWQNINVGRGVLVFENYHEFALWYKNKSYEWKQDDLTEFTISYHGNGHTGGDVPSSVIKQLDVDITVENKGSLNRDHHDFIEWNTRSDGKGLKFSGGDVFFINADTTLYAQWTKQSYIIAYDGNGHTGGSEPSSSSQVHGEFTIIKDNGNLLRAGYIFVNWNTEPNGSGTSYSVGDSISFTSNITLYAQWQVVYTVKYILTDDVSGPTLAPQTKYHDIPLQLYENSGKYKYWDTVYISDGWKTGGGLHDYGDLYTSGQMYTLNENVTLYPRWKEGPKPFILYVAILDEATGTYFSGKTGGQYDGTGATDKWKSDWTGWENDIACANYEGIDPPEVLVFHVFHSRSIYIYPENDPVNENGQYGLPYAFSEGNRIIKTAFRPSSYSQTSQTNFFEMMKSEILKIWPYAWDNELWPYDWSNGTPNYGLQQIRIHYDASGSMTADDTYYVRKHWKTFMKKMGKTFYESKKTNERWLKWLIDDFKRVNNL